MDDGKGFLTGLKMDLLSPILLFKDEIILKHERATYPGVTLGRWLVRGRLHISLLVLKRV